MRTNVATVKERKNKSMWKPNFYMLVRTVGAVYTIDVSNGLSVYPKLTSGNDSLESATEFAIAYLNRNFHKVKLVTNKEYMKRGAK